MGLCISQESRVGSWALVSHITSIQVRLQSEIPGLANEAKLRGYRLTEFNSTACLQNDSLIESSSSVGPLLRTASVADARNPFQDLSV
jgi:hypothetical protein